MNKQDFETLSLTLVGGFSLTGIVIRVFISECFSLYEDCRDRFLNLQRGKEEVKHARATNAGE